MTVPRKRNVPIIRPPSRPPARPGLACLLGDSAARRHWAKYWVEEPLGGGLELAAYYLFRVLPIGLCSRLGASRGRYVGATRKRVEDQARQALAMIAPALPPAEVDALLCRLHRNSGRALLETLVMDRIWQGGHVAVLPDQRRQALKDPSQSRIFVSVHTSNLGDLLGMCLMQLIGSRGMTVSRKQPNRFRQQLSEKLRSKHGAAVLEPGLRTTRQLLEHLRGPGGAILIHLDEARGKQIYFPTFGRPMPYGSNLSLAIRLSAATGAPLTPVYLMRRAGHRFDLHVCDDLPAPAARDSAGHDAIARKLDQLFEGIIRSRLDDWQQLYFLRP